MKKPLDLTGHIKHQMTAVTQCVGDPRAVPVLMPAKKEGGRELVTPTPPDLKALEAYGTWDALPGDTFPGEVAQNAAINDHKAKVAKAWGFGIDSSGSMSGIDPQPEYVREYTNNWIAKTDEEMMAEMSVGMVRLKTLPHLKNTDKFMEAEKDDFTLDHQPRFDIAKLKQSPDSLYMDDAQEALRWKSAMAKSADFKSIVDTVLLTNAPNGQFVRSANASLLGLQQMAARYGSNEHFQDRQFYKRIRDFSEALLSVGRLRFMADSMLRWLDKQDIPKAQREPSELSRTGKALLAAADRAAADYSLSKGSDRPEDFTLHLVSANLPEEGPPTLVCYPSIKSRGLVINVNLPNGGVSVSTYGEADAKGTRKLVSTMVLTKRRKQDATSGFHFNPVTRWEDFKFDEDPASPVASPTEPSVFSHLEQLKELMEAHEIPLRPLEAPPSRVDQAVEKVTTLYNEALKKDMQQPGLANDLSRIVITGQRAPEGAFDFTSKDDPTK